MHYAAAARLQPDGTGRQAPAAALLDRRNLPRPAAQRSETPAAGSARNQQLRSFARPQPLAYSVSASAVRPLAVPTAAAAQDAELRKGALVEVKKQHRSLLVVLSRIEGKQKCFGLDKARPIRPSSAASVCPSIPSTSLLTFPQRRPVSAPPPAQDGNQHSFFVRDVGFVAAGREFEWRELAELEAECERLTAESISDKLEVVWDASKDGKPALTTAEARPRPRSRAPPRFLPPASLRHISPLGSCPAPRPNPTPPPPPSPRQICELVFGTHSPAAAWATHRALSEDNLFFRRGAARGLWQPLQEQQVAERTKKQAQQQELAAVQEGFRARVSEALAAPHGAKPPAAAWLERPAWAQWLAALEAAALEDERDPAKAESGADVLRTLGFSAARPARRGHPTTSSSQAAPGVRVGAPATTQRSLTAASRPRLPTLRRLPRRRRCSSTSASGPTTRTSPCAKRVAAAAAALAAPLHRRSSPKTRQPIF